MVASDRWWLPSLPVTVAVRDSSRPFAPEAASRIGCRRRYRGSVVKGAEGHFRRKREALLTAEGPPQAQRAIPRAEPYHCCLNDRQDMATGSLVYFSRRMRARRAAGSSRRA
jgi:hypothetical protein